MEEDHYLVLGVSRKASKKEIKEAFRRLAVEFHPDKHARSSDSDRRRATLRFKHLSHSYDVLSDDLKRADYDLRSARFRGGYGYGHRSYGGGSGGGFTPRGSAADVGGGGFVSRFESVVRYLTTRAFLLNAAFAGALLGGMLVIDMGREALWKMQNSGKSFEEAMESIEREKTSKNDMYDGIR